jgi:hypothetical protein
MNRLILFASLVIINQLAFSQKKKQDAPPAPVSISPIAAKVAGMKKYEGYFEYYYDEKQDKIFLLIDKFDTEVLHIESLTAAIGSNDIGLDRNQLGKEREQSSTD